MDPGSPLLSILGSALVFVSCGSWLLPPVEDKISLVLESRSPFDVLAVSSYSLHHCDVANNGLI